MCHHGVALAPRSPSPSVAFLAPALPCRVRAGRAPPRPSSACEGPKTFDNQAWIVSKCGRRFPLISQKTKLDPSLGDPRTRTPPPPPSPDRNRVSSDSVAGRAVLGSTVFLAATMRRHECRRGRLRVCATTGDGAAQFVVIPRTWRAACASGRFGSILYAASYAWRPRLGSPALQ